MSDTVITTFHPVPAGPDPDRGGVIAVVTLNRPLQLNAINPPLGKALAAAFRVLNARSDVRAAVMTGAGRAFSAGVDLKDPLFADPQIMTREWMLGDPNYLVQMQRATYPIIGAVAGACITGGMEIALNCDILVTAPCAFFWDTHSLYKIRPGNTLSWNDMIVLN